MLRGLFLPCSLLWGPIVEKSLLLLSPLLRGTIVAESIFLGFYFAGSIVGECNVSESFYAGSLVAKFIAAESNVARFIVGESFEQCTLLRCP